MPSEPRQFPPSKPEAASPTSIHGEVALAKHVHSNESIETEFVSKLEPAYLFEQEWQ
jgi:hypothetical protein